jgi:hypothetical protein
VEILNFARAPLPPFVPKEAERLLMEVNQTAGAAFDLSPFDHWIPDSR